MLDVLRRSSQRPAFRKVITLTLEGGLRSAVVLGDDHTLEEAFHDIFANARRLGSGNAVNVGIVERDEGFEVHIDHPAPGLTVPQCEQLMETATVLDLRDDNVPVAAGGWVNAAEAFAAHGGTLEFEEVASGGLRLTVTFPKGPAVNQGPRSEHVG